MAQRPAFSLAPADSSRHPVQVAYYDFDWSPGMSAAQKRKNVAALHASIRERILGAKPLEVSSKSTLPIGIALSAFNLAVVKNGQPFRVESLYQGSKVFRDGSGPFHDLYAQSPKAVRAAIKPHASSPLVHFAWGRTHWPLEPKLAFYTWLYCTALHHVQNRPLADKLLREEFTHFTDIEYNPGRTLNSQSFAVAYYLHLVRTAQADAVLVDRDTFLGVFPAGLPEGFRTESARRSPAPAAGIRKIAMTQVHGALGDRALPRGTPVLRSFQGRAGSPSTPLQRRCRHIANCC